MLMYHICGSHVRSAFGETCTWRLEVGGMELEISHI